MRRLAIVLPLLVGACDEPLDQRLAIIREPRVLAITSEPAEAKPGETVTYSAIVASPDGPILDVPHWSYCTAGKPPTEDNVVSAPCLGEDSLISLGDQLALTGTIPMEACRVFGPDVPDVGFRPRDPDPSGGYFQPVRADVAGLRAFGLSRIRCNLPNASAEDSRAYAVGYAPNISPSLVTLVIRRVGDDQPLAFDALPADTDVELVAAWPANARESYLYYDRAAAKLVTRFEALRVSWYATAGELAVDTTGTTEDDDARSVSTTFHTPTRPGPAWIWLVLRDSRGGLATQVVALEID